VPVTICDHQGGVPRGASWGPDDTVIFATNASSGLWRVHVGGGEPEELTTPDPEQGDHLWPEILPGGEGVLFTIMSGPVENAQIAVLSLVTGEIKVLIPGGSNPRYARTGHIVYGVGGTLRAVGFDVERLEVTSDPIPVLDGVITKTSGAGSSASRATDPSCISRAVCKANKTEHSCGWIGTEGKRRSPPSPEPTPTRASLPMGAKLPSTCAIRRGTSGSGILPARR
jgi:hypothetical protein